MIAVSKKTCRKCGALNREDNIYCKKCGAVLDVRTTEIRAQPKPVMPRLEGTRWRYVAIGVFVMLGVTTFFSGLAVLIVQSTGWSVSGLSDLVENLLQLSLAAVGIFSLSFGVGGMVLVWLAREYILFEVVISAILMIVLLGVVGSVLTSDLMIVAGVLLVPSTAAAATGAKIARR